MTRLFASRVAQEFLPGETWAYSNTGYLLLGDIIERVSGSSVLGVSPNARIHTGWNARNAEQRSASGDSRPRSGVWVEQRRL